MWKSIPSQLSLHYFLDVVEDWTLIIEIWACVSTTTEVPEIQDEVRPKSLAPPPTAQTAGPNWLKFFLEAPLVDAFRITEAIFVFHSRSRDIGAAPSHPRDPLGVKKCQKIFFFKTNFFRHDRYLWCLKRPQQPFFRQLSPLFGRKLNFCQRLKKTSIYVSHWFQNGSQRTNHLADLKYIFLYLTTAPKQYLIPEFLKPGHKVCLIIYFV